MEQEREKQKGERREGVSKKNQRNKEAERSGEGEESLPLPGQRFALPICFVIKEDVKSCVLNDF